MSEPSIDFEIIWRKIHGTLSEHEERLFFKWLSASDENRRYFESVRIHYEEGATAHEYNSQSIKEAWSRIDQHLTKTQRPNPRRWIWSTFAASLIAVLTVWYFSIDDEERQIVAKEVVKSNAIIPGSSKAVLITSDGTKLALDDQAGSNFSISDAQMESQDGTLTYRNNPGNYSNKQHELIIPRGGKYSLVLGDGTKVWINSESRLKYPVNFSNEERTVFLSGEAYFDVAEDKSRPFNVITDKQVVSVLGTEFNVSAYSDQSTEHTTLVEGKVKVSINSVEVTDILTPGFQAHLDKRSNQYSNREVDTFIFSGWKDDLFVFEDEPLGDMLTTLSRWYDVQVFYNNAEASNIKFTGEIERYESFENILRLIEKTNTVRFEIKNRSVIVN